MLYFVTYSGVLRTCSFCHLIQVLTYAPLILPLPWLILVSKRPHILSHEPYLGKFWKIGLEKRIFIYSCLPVKKRDLLENCNFYKFLDVTLISRVFIQQTWNLYILRDHTNSNIFFLEHYQERPRFDFLKLITLEKTSLRKDEVSVLYLKSLKLGK